MITLCLGSARQKREYFKNNGMLVLDNVEVLFCASENGLNYFAYGEVPFSEFTVGEYLNYRRALCGGGADLTVLERMGIPTIKRMGKLCNAARRGVMLAEKSGGEEMNASVVINLDGTKYSRKNMRYLNRLVGLCKNAYVLVTDKRFVKNMKTAFNTLYFGKPEIKTRTRFYAARVLAKRIGATKIAVM